MSKAQVAIIGGGVIGASIAYHLARAGVDDIVIIDRSGGPGAGSTGRATGGFRAQFATPINVRLSLLSREALLRFEAETGVDPQYQQVGYLWLASTERELGAIRSALKVQHAEGLNEARELSLADIADVNPLLATDDLVGASFCATDGYIRPLEILRGYLENAERLGVRFLWGTECVAMEKTAQRITSIETTSGSISADNVVNAAGAWAGRIGAMAGIDTPVQPLRRQAAFTVPTNVVPPDMPMSIFMNDGFHIRARDGRALICWPNPEPFSDPDLLSADDQWIDTVSAMARARVPALRNVEIDRRLAYAGLYEMSPDHHAILGAHPACENLFFANGSSGHGVMHSPAIGSIVADLVMQKRPQIDVSVLRPSRFEENDAVEASELL